MTYYNGNPYAGPTASAPLDRFAHDHCLPDDQFEVTMLPDFTQPVTNGDGTAGWAKTPHRHQVWPWHWSPLWGAPEPCYVCGLPVR